MGSQLESLPTPESFRWVVTSIGSISIDSGGMTGESDTGKAKLRLVHKAADITPVNESVHQTVVLSTGRECKFRGD